MKSNAIAAILVASSLTACSSMPDMRTGWMKRKFVDVDTVLTGDAATLMPNLYGTYRVVGKNRWANLHITEIKLVRSEKGNPVLRFFNKNGKELAFWKTPQECHGTRSKSGDFQSIECGMRGGIWGIDQFMLTPELPYLLKSIYPKNIPITDGSYHFSLHESYGAPGAEFSLQKVE